MIKDFRRVYCDFCDNKYIDIDFTDISDEMFSLEEDTEDFLLQSKWSILDDMHICEDCAYKQSLQ